MEYAASVISLLPTLIPTLQHHRQSSRLMPISHQALPASTGAHSFALLANLSEITGGMMCL